jgi:RND family efflux transporter MFP subunit
MKKTRALIALALLVSGAGAPAAVAATEAPVPAAAARVRAARLEAPGGGALVPAAVQAAKRATVSTRIAAQVREVHVTEGTRVRAGDRLVTLAGEDVRGGLAAAESGLAAAASHERRIRALIAERAATAAELDQAVAQRAQAEAAVAAGRASLSYTELRAPFAGTIQARRVEPGDLVGPGQPLVEVEGEALELVASLAEVEAAGLAVGAELRFEAGEARGTAVVTALAEGGDRLSHRRALRARVKSSEGTLRSGGFARLELPSGAAAATELWVPRSALVERGDLTGLFVAKEGHAQLRWVSVGERAGDRVRVRAGLRRGEVVVDAPGALRDGAAVEVAP